jgi:hypothetical protein
MKEVYVHTLRYHFYGRGNRKSRVMFPISHGPFKDEDAAREWIRQTGITCATKLMGDPATENIQVPAKNPAMLKTGEFRALVDIPTQRSSFGGG